MFLRVTSRMALPRHVYHDLPALQRDPVRLGDIRARFQAGIGCRLARRGLLGFDADIIAADAHARRVEPGLPAANVELPAVPRAAQHLARAAVVVIAGTGSDDQPAQRAGAQRPTLVRAAV